MSMTKAHQNMYTKHENYKNSHKLWFLLWSVYSFQALWNSLSRWWQSHVTLFNIIHLIYFFVGVCMYVCMYVCMCVLYAFEND